MGRGTNRAEGDTERSALAARYRDALLDDVIPFWMKHGIDRRHGGYLTALDRDGSVVDTDKAVWFLGRGAWMFATLYNTVEPRRAWLEAARSGLDFLRRHAYGPRRKLYFTLTREGRPLRMRRYVYSECFAAIAFAAWARATGEAESARDAVRAFAAFLRYQREPGRIAPKTDPGVRPSKGLAPLMMTIATAQELRANLGEDARVLGAPCSAWIDRAIDEIRTDFFKPRLGALMETVGPGGEIHDHVDGRLLNPGHALECAWFILHEARLRSDAALQRFGLRILDAMWARGWDDEFGGLFYFRDLRGLPVQEYWQDMKFWWPHNEAVIATLLAHVLTGDPKYAAMHRRVHDWAFGHFADPIHGEWFGYLRRDGAPANTLKGSLWKGPFHLPRMLWYAWRLLDE